MERECAKQGLAVRQMRRGQTTVEFAFVVIAFLLLVMMAVDLGRGILDNNMLSNAVREGARYGIINSNSTTSICNVVRARMGISQTGCGNSSNLTVDVQQGCNPQDPYINSSKESVTAVVVKAQYKFTLITPLIGGITGNPITLSAKSVMYNETAASNPGVCVP